MMNILVHYPEKIPADPDTKVTILVVHINIIPVMTGLQVISDRSRVVFLRAHVHVLVLAQVVKPL